MPKHCLVFEAVSGDTHFWKMKIPSLSAKIKKIKSINQLMCKTRWYPRENNSILRSRCLRVLITNSILFRGNYQTVTNILKSTSTGRDRWLPSIPIPSISHRSRVLDRHTDAWKKLLFPVSLVARDVCVLINEP